MQIRVQRGGLSDSLRTTMDIEPTAKAIAEYLRLQWGGLGYGVDENKITVEPYGFDNRIQWNTHIVLLDGRAVAFTDGPLTPDDLPESCAPSNQQ